VEALWKNHDPAREENHPIRLGTSAQQLHLEAESMVSRRRETDTKGNRGNGKHRAGDASAQQARATSTHQGHLSPTSDRRSLPRLSSRGIARDLPT
jgi:hypothetical protein